MAIKAKKVRLDELVLKKGLASSRSLARSLILAGKVRRGTERLDKPGKIYPEDIDIYVDTPPRFVGRGGEKLAGFLKKHPLEIKSTRCLDVGASTGGFTDCLLQEGASHSTCVDVGKGQLHYKLRTDERVCNLEGINARNLKLGDLPYSKYDITVMDLSFISLTKVLSPIWQFVKPGGILIALIKPQFEAGKEEADRFRGIIKDEKIHQRVLQEINIFIQDHLNDAVVFALEKSTVKGTDGNQEFLIGLKRNNTTIPSLSEE